MQYARVFAVTRYAVQLLAGLAAISVAGFALAQAGLWTDRGGVGLRPSNPALSELTATSRTDPSAEQQATSLRDYQLYSGQRELPRLGSPASETYSGVAHSLSARWASSLEAGVISASPSTPRRYSVAGEIGTALAGGRGVSVGLKYRQYDTAAGPWGEPYGAPWAGTEKGYALAPSALSGPDSSYEVRLRYQYSTASSFGLALGRDLETGTLGLDAPANSERQLMFTGQHWLTPKWGLTYDLLSDEPGGSMRVQGLRLGVRYRF